MNRKPRYAKLIKFVPVKAKELHPSLRTINLKLYNRAMKAIADEPSQFDMDWWYSGSVIDPRTKGSMVPPNCGTAACFGGWVIALKKRKTPKEARNLIRERWERFDYSTSSTASKMLELPNDSGGAGDRLFSHNLWPNKWGSIYEFYKEAGSHRKAALVALKRFKHYLLTAE